MKTTNSCPDGVPHRRNEHSVLILDLRPSTGRPSLQPMWSTDTPVIERILEWMRTEGWGDFHHG
jgi:hypothetical protein